MAFTYSEEEVFLKKLTELIVINLANEKFCVSELAREMGMSRTSLHRKVKSAAILSVSQYIRQIRLNRARELLKQTSSTSSEIAYEVGFGSVTYFTKCFHDYYGYPPGEVRKRYVSDPDSDEHLHHIRNPKSRIKSIAVLPFDNYTGDESQAYLVSGIHDALINELCQLGGIRVVSKTSAITYSNSEKTIRKIASELNVETIIEASVLFVDEMIRVQVKLFNAFPEEQQLWAQTFDVEQSDIPKLSSRIIKSIANELQLTITPDQQNLPLQLTSFIGRKKEMRVIRELIRKHRIVSLIGPGGCGKTRLACEVAYQLVTDYRDGVWFVDLSSISSPDLVANEITDVLKIPEEPNRSIIDTLIDKIKLKNLLILLDNCEHLITACAIIAGKLVKSVPELQILLTSREEINIQGEKVWRIPSLTLVDPETVIDVERARSSEAVLLFTDRAQMNNPEFELVSGNVNEVVTICNKLDGIPLAVELVASRTKHMDPRVILERFSDKFNQLDSADPGTSERQKTLSASIEWSYNLLSDREQILFTRLTVFKGGFDLKAVEEVCANEKLPREEILNLLSRLVDRSMIYTIQRQGQSMRYNCLETLRQFAMQIQESRSEEDAIRNRHFQYYLKISEEAYEEQFGQQLEWLTMLELDHDNLIAALIWSENPNPEGFVRLSGFLAWFWRSHSHFMLGMEYLEKALLIAPGNSEDQARVLFGMATMLIYTEEHQRFLDLMNRSLEIWRQFNNLQEEARVLSEISEAYFRNGDSKASLNCSELGLGIARKVGNPYLINHCLLGLCQIFVYSKQFDRARLLTEELRVSSAMLEQPNGVITANHLLGDCAIGSRNFKEAEKEYGHNLREGMEFGDSAIVCVDLQGVAFALSGQSRWAKCIRLDAAAREYATQLGIRLDGVAEFWDEWIETYLEGARKEVMEEFTRQYEEDGRNMGFEAAVEYALDFEKD